MSSVLSHRVIHITDFKKNPAQAVRDASPQPLAVLNRRRLEFYAVDPRLYTGLVERVRAEDAEELARSLVAAGGNTPSEGACEVVVGSDESLTVAVKVWG